MKRVAIYGLALALVSGLVLVGCYSEPEKAAEEVAVTPDPTAPQPLEDPGTEEAAEVEAFVEQWVADAAGEGGVYGIPPRGDHAVSRVQRLDGCFGGLAAAAVDGHARAALEKFHGGGVADSAGRPRNQHALGIEIHAGFLIGRTRCPSS